MSTGSISNNNPIQIPGSFGGTSSSTPTQSVDDETANSFARLVNSSAQTSQTSTAGSHLSVIIQDIENALAAAQQAQANGGSPTQASFSYTNPQTGKQSQMSIAALCQKAGITLPANNKNCTQSEGSQILSEIKSLIDSLKAGGQDNETQSKASQLFSDGKAAAGAVKANEQTHQPSPAQRVISDIQAAVDAVKVNNQ
jgi:hypothetical protein